MAMCATPLLAIRFRLSMTHTPAQPPLHGNTLAPPAALAHEAMRVLGVNLLIWGLICSLGAAGDYRDRLQLGQDGGFWPLWWTWLNAHIPLFSLSVGLMLLLSRSQERFTAGSAIAGLYGALALLYFPLHMGYLALTAALRHGAAQNWWPALLRMDHFTWFIEFAWFTGSFAVVMAVHVWRLGQQRSAELQASREANLALELALERQRLQGMRRQLEPHFIFNALNSISALVRSKEQDLALEGIASLSALLRYALKASTQDAVRLGDEIEFCEDYLALQEMRYGPRLQCRFEGLSPQMQGIEIPPLLLQPLIENALRHDLDRHDGSTDLRLHFALEGARLHIEITNSLGPRGPANPGLGLGLSHTRERLALMYGPQASLHTEEQAQRYQVRLELPAHAGDAHLAPP